MSLTKLADLLVSTKTSIPWLVSALGAPAWVLPLLVPIRESGSMLPQWLLKRTVTDKHGDRTKLWRIGAFVQMLAIVALIPCALWLQGFWLGVGIVVAIAVVAIGRALSSLTMKDIQGELVSKGKRGKLVGMASMLSAVLTGVTAVSLLLADEQKGIGFTLTVIGAAAILMLFAIGLSLTIGVNLDTADLSSNQQLASAATLWRQSSFRHLVISRSLLLHSALFIPLVVAGADTQNSFNLPWFILVAAGAGVISSNLWGKWADKNVVATIKIAALLAVGIGLAYTLFLDQSLVGALVSFFFLSLAHGGIRIGRKTYLLDVTSSDNRSSYTAAANTLVGLVLLILGALYAALYQYSSLFALSLMTLALMAGLVHSCYLPKAEIEK